MIALTVQVEAALTERMVYVSGGDSEVFVRDPNGTVIQFTEGPLFVVSHPPRSSISWYRSYRVSAKRPDTIFGEVLMHRSLCFLALTLGLGACHEPSTSPSEPWMDRPVTAALAPQPTQTCSVRPLLGGYEVHVTWTRTPAASIELNQDELSTFYNPSRVTRKATIVVQSSFQPLWAVFYSRRGASLAAVECDFVSS